MNRTTRQVIFWFVVLGIPLLIANWLCMPHAHEAMEAMVDKAPATFANIFTSLLLWAEGVVGSIGALLGLVIGACYLGSASYDWFVEDDEPEWYTRLQKKRAKKKEQKKLRVATPKKVAHQRVDDEELRLAETEVEEFLTTKGL